jgi:hypothetical protein
MDYKDVKTAKDKLEKVIDKQKFPKLVKWHKQDDSSEKNKTGSDSKERKKSVVEKKHLVNKLNYLNFQDKTINVNFKHRKYNHYISFQAKPLPCVGDRLDCLWTQKPKINNPLNSFEFHNFVVTDGQKRLVVKPELTDINDMGVCFKLPERCYEAVTQKAKKHSCKRLKSQLIQNSAVFHGTLMDFNATSFSVKIKSTPPQTFQWINTESPVNIIFSDGNETLYSGECSIIKQSNGDKNRNFTIEPFSQQIQRFAPKKYRSMRQKVVPSPNAVFNHPFTGKRVDLKVVDLAGSGFSVEDDAETPVLLPGMIIPELELTFAGSFKMKCNTQVVHRNAYRKDDKDRVKCGLVFLDLDVEDHTRLLSLLYQAENKNAYICNAVDQDALWDFFFEAGFIYPNKYMHIKGNKEKIKSTYNKLYSNSPNIARHFIYQDKGVILAHMAILRSYENTWLIQHHASLSPLVKAGLVVMNQMGRFTYDAHRLYSIHMDYLIGYYRPENKFPDLVFGGAARSIKNPKGCSLDNFAYFYQTRTVYDEPALPKPWELTRTKPEDLQELQNFYEVESGGLMIKALDLGSVVNGSSKLSKEYRKLGFKRSRYVLSLKKYGDLKAVIMVNISNVGLNLSDLTNCIKVFVLNQDDLSKDTLNLILSILLEKIGQNNIPVLLYPVSYADNQSIPYEKIYTLWTLSTLYSDSYFKHIERLLKFRASQPPKENNF